MIRSWVRSFLGHDELQEALDNVLERLRLLEGSMQARLDIERDSIDRLRALQAALDDGILGDNADLLSDLNLDEFDPQLGM